MRDTREVSAAALRRAAQDYAGDAGEGVAVVEAALRRVLRETPCPAHHPVASGELARALAFAPTRAGGR